MSTGQLNDPAVENATIICPSSQTQTSSYPLAEAEYGEIAENPDLFYEKLQNFHRKFGTKFKIPTIGGRTLDLHRLFVEVTSRGGIQKVVGNRKWKDVIMLFDYPSTITSASFVLRKYYLSLLYHFEQLYYFHKKAPSILPTDSVSRIVNGSSALHVLQDNTAVHQSSDDPNLEAGSSVVGTIDAKFDNGYLVTVDLGSEQLKGVLYHIPDKVSHMSQISNTYGIGKPPHRSRSRFQDPSRPKANRSGYNFFFAENYNRLKPLYHGQEKTITKKIGHLWNRLTNEDKQVYQEKGLRDKERYKIEMLEYRSTSNLQA